MNRFLFGAALLGLVSCESPTTEAIIPEVINQLEQTQTFACDYTFKQIVPASPGASWQAEGHLAVDYTADNALGARVYADRLGERGFQRIFANDTLLDFQVETATLVRTANTQKMWLYGNLSLFATPFELREILPLALQDSGTRIDRVFDTTLAGEKVIRIDLAMEKSIVFGQLHDNETAPNRYRLTVRKEDLRPVQWESLFEDGSFAMTYTNWQTTIPDSVWTLAEKHSDYLQMSGEEYRERERNNLSAQEGKKLSAWSLPTMEGDTLSSESYQQQLTLYEFFFVGCSGSIAAQPHIEKLKEQFGDQLQVVNIETQGFTQPEVQRFAEKYELRKPVLCGGSELATELGVIGCPTFVLVDQSGTIVHAVFAETDQLESVISAQLASK